MKNIPQRSCVACRTQKNKNELLRIVTNNKNETKIDKTGKESGRGAYICYSKDCLEKAIKTKKIEINQDMYKEIIEIIENKNGGEVIG